MAKAIAFVDHMDFGGQGYAYLTLIGIFKAEGQESFAESSYSIYGTAPIDASADSFNAVILNMIKAFALSEFSITMSNSDIMHQPFVRGVNL